jgi:ElaB/YqjD/DUF883 family membrane-anchored ribosome-binding protein
MADTNYPPSTVVTYGDAAAPVPKATGEHAGTVIGEFVDAARSAAESLLEEQKRQVADRVQGVAEALRHAADPLHRSQNHVVADYVARAAEQVERFTRTLHERRWNELIADTEEFARRQPTGFVLGAVAAGFVLGRLLWASAGAEFESQVSARAGGGATETRRSVTAAISSGSGASDATGYGAGASGTMGTR